MVMLEDHSMVCAPCFLCSRASWQLAQWPHNLHA